MSCSCAISPTVKSTDLWLSAQGKKSNLNHRLITNFINLFVFAPWSRIHRFNVLVLSLFSFSLALNCFVLLFCFMGWFLFCCKSSKVEDDDNPEEEITRSEEEAEQACLRSEIEVEQSRTSRASMQCSQMLTSCRKSSCHVANLCSQLLLLFCIITGT